MKFTAMIFLGINRVKSQQLYTTKWIKQFCLDCCIEFIWCCNDYAS